MKRLGAGRIDWGPRSSDRTDDLSKGKNDSAANPFGNLRLSGLETHPRLVAVPPLGNPLHGPRIPALAERFALDRQPVISMA